MISVWIKIKKVLHIFCQQNQLPNMMKPPPAQSTKPHNFSGRFYPKKEKQSLTSWWLNQPIWKICSSKWESLPNRGENKHIWNHHLVDNQGTGGRNRWTPKSRTAQRNEVKKIHLCLLARKNDSDFCILRCLEKKCQKSPNGGEWVKDGEFHDSWYKSVKKKSLKWT